MDEPDMPDIAAAFAHYEPFGIVPGGWMDQLRRVRESCPVVHSNACDGFWLVSRHDDVATVLRTPAVFSSAEEIVIRRIQMLQMMPTIDLDPPLQTEFRQLLNPYFTAAAVRPYAPVIASRWARVVPEPGRVPAGFHRRPGRREPRAAVSRPLH